MTRGSEERRVGLHRPVEPFHRPYAGPEPPSPSRRRGRLVLPVAAAAVAVAAVAVFLVVPGRDGGDAAGPRAPGATPPVSGPASGPASSPAGERMITALPPPCGAVSRNTVDGVVPGSRSRQSANSTLTTCTFSSTGSAFRWLRVETYLYAPANTGTPVKDAEGYYDAQWAQAHRAPLVRTISLERDGDLGDEAYRWFKADEGQPTVVGEVTVRVRNAVFTVSYSERAAGDKAARERACLDRATRVAREVAAALTHF